MALNIRETRAFLQKGDLTHLFVEQLGWDYYDAPLQVAVDGEQYYGTPPSCSTG
jgi:hypothetical protein